MHSKTPFHFEVVARDSATGARLGRFTTPHGIVETPAFMPVGTQATVKTVDPVELRDAGAQMILANTYHLALRPGAERVATLGGLHRFMAWDRPILTDSGGFQIWSLADGRRGSLVRIDDDGATFQSYLDGRRWRFTPEAATEIQVKLGADVIMALDECTAKDADERTAVAAAQRTYRWARRCQQRWLQVQSEGESPQALFGIIQGGCHRHLRRSSAEEIVSLDLPGVAVGGESIGFSKEQTADVLDWISDLLPSDRPRYAMGVGDPADFVTVVDRGIDLFDSVLPTRLARNGALLTRQGRLRIGAAVHRDDDDPIDPQCRCITCRSFGRAYLHHLYRSNELLGHRLGTIHNLTYCLDVTDDMRQALREGSYGKLRGRWSANSLRLEV
jgi:queuine tRNA-ribosyltransferase